MPISDFSVAFLCPFDLDRQTGTPIRGAMVVGEMRKCATATAVTLGGKALTDVLLDGIWKRSRNGKRLHFRLGRYTVSCLKALVRLRPSVLHLFSSVPFPAAWIYRAVRPNTRVITEFHGLFEHEMMDARWTARSMYTAMDRWAARRSDGIVAMSGIMKNHLAAAYGARQERCDVILGPVDLVRFPCRPKRRGRPLVVGYSGNSSRWQGLHGVFEACRKLRESRALRFVFCGFPKDSVRIPEQENVEVMGVVAPDRLPEVVAGYDVFLSTRLPEPASEYQYPSKISMALATGRPILATRVGEQARVIEVTRCGILVEPGNVESLVEALVRLPSMSDDEWSDMGRRGRAFAEKELDLAALGAKLLSLYRRRPADS